MITLSLFQFDAAIFRGAPADLATCAQKQNQRQRGKGKQESSLFFNPSIHLLSIYWQNTFSIFAARPIYNNMVFIKKKPV